VLAGWLVAARSPDRRQGLASFDFGARKGGRDVDRRKGEAVSVQVTHGTSTSLDPQLHIHCVLFSETWDATESRWKALPVHDMCDRSACVAGVYRNELARRVKALGCEVRPALHGFEIVGLSQELIPRFSKRRRAALEAVAKVLSKAGRARSNNPRATLAAPLPRRGADRGSRDARPRLSPGRLPGLRPRRRDPSAECLQVLQRLRRPRLGGASNLGRLAAGHQRLCPAQHRRLENHDAQGV